MSVLEFIFKGGSLERKVQLKLKVYFRRTQQVNMHQDPMTFEVLQFKRYFQSGVKAKSLVAQALTNTNSNIFNVSGIKVL